MPKLHIDIETYSEVDIRKAGAYRYIKDDSFEIMLIAFAIDDQPVQIVDLSDPTIVNENYLRFLEIFKNPDYELHAHNANFERLAFNRVGLFTTIDRWHCSMIKAAYCGLPLKLEDISKVLDLGENAKLDTGTILINYFAKPCKPTKTNGGRLRNLPEHDTDKWQLFKEYCINDVKAESEIDRLLSVYPLPTEERQYYQMDQEINDRGVLIDIEMVDNIIDINTQHTRKLIAGSKKLTGLDNPNSLARLKNWLFIETGENIQSLSKETIQPLIDKQGAGVVSDVLNLRKELGKTSIKKYNAMVNSVLESNRSHGLFQFYGAGRTGRWSGRLVQLQNLPQNHLPDLDQTRDYFKNCDYETLQLIYDDLPSIMSQLIRTAFIAPENYTFAVADFSSIEARVLSWLAGETWRLEIFKTHGKIYEASAAAMFNVPIENISKDSPLRQKGKIAELALGYGGSTGALTLMGGEKMGLSFDEMDQIVQAWRAANPRIVQFWRALENNAKAALRNKGTGFKAGVIKFIYDGDYIRIGLPSGRELFYKEPSFTTNRFGQQSLKYKGQDQTSKQWTWIETYGGKLAENVTQAIARDLLAAAMLEYSRFGSKMAIHVHDEIVAEVPDKTAKYELNKLIEIMSTPPLWALGLPLGADGFVSKYYRK